MMQTIPRVPGRDALRNVSQAAASAATQVVVQRDWSGWRKAMAPMTALESVHWRQPAGAPRPLIHAYVSCRDLISGDVPHECGEQAAHRLLVCILRQHTAPSVFQALVERANAVARL
jgi:hypothetical protein